MADFAGPATVLLGLLGELLDELDGEADVGCKDYTVLNDDVRALMYACRKLSWESEGREPLDNVARGTDGLLVHVGFAGGVDEPAVLELGRVGLITSAKEDDAVEKSRTASLKHERSSHSTQSH